jgi:hypothetical protein
VTHPRLALCLQRLEERPRSAQHLLRGSGAPQRQALLLLRQQRAQLSVARLRVAV